MKAPLLAAWFVSLVPLLAQKPPTLGQDELVKRRTAKLALPVFAQNGWLTDYQKAKDQCRATGKPVFFYGTRSDVDDPGCIAFEESELPKPEFVPFLAGVVPFVHVTSRVDGEPDATLVKDLGFKTWPAFGFLDADGKLLGKPRRDPVQLRATAERLRDLLTLRGKGTQRTADEQKRWFLGELEVGTIRSGDVVKLAEGYTFTPEERARMTQCLVELEVDETFARFRELGAEEVGKKFAGMVRGERTPTGEMAGAFWLQVLQRAADGKDLDLGAIAFARLEAIYQGIDSPGMRKQRALWRSLLDKVAARQQPGK